MLFVLYHVLHEGKIKDYTIIDVYYGCSLISEI